MAKDLLSKWGPALAVLLALVVYDKFLRAKPVPTPPPSPSIVTIAREYRDTMGDAYLKEAKKVRSGETPDLETLLKGLREHAVPLAKAIDKAFKPLTATKDKKHPFDDPEAAADILEQVGKGLK